MPRSAPARARDLCRTGALTAATLLAGAALAPSAGANFAGSASDPAGDATDPGSGRDLQSAGFGYDRRTGTVSVTLALTNRPLLSEDGVGLRVFLAKRSPTGCDQTPGVAAAGQTQSSDLLDWLLQTGPASAPPAGTGTARNLNSFDAVQRFSFSGTALKARGFDCAVARTVALEDPTRIIDEVGPIALKALPELRMAITGVPKTIARGSRRTITVKLTNPGDAAATGAKVKVARAAGLKAVASTAFGTIAPGRTVTRRIAVTATGTRPTVDLKLTAATGSLSVARSYTLGVYKKGSRRGGSGGGSAGAQMLCNQFAPDLSGQSGGSLILVPC